MARYKVNAGGLPWAPGQVVTEDHLEASELARLLKTGELSPIGGEAPDHGQSAPKVRKSRKAKAAS